MYNIELARYFRIFVSATCPPRATQSSYARYSLMLCKIACPPRGKHLLWIYQYWVCFCGIGRIHPQRLLMLRACGAWRRVLGRVWVGGVDALSPPTPGGTYVEWYDPQVMCTYRLPLGSVGFTLGVLSSLSIFVSDFRFSLIFFFVFSSFFFTFSFLHFFFFLFRFRLFIFRLFYFFFIVHQTVSENPFMSRMKIFPEPEKKLRVSLGFCAQI